VVVLGPQGTLFFLFLLLAFAGLVTWMVLASHVVFRVLAACLAFLPAMAFGVATVNKYYDYYQTWGALFSDLSGQAPSAPQISAASLGNGNASSLEIALGQSGQAKLAAQYGLLFHTVISGTSSHISRQGYIYLPPQYFSAAYKSYKFPAVELLHGSPGQPSAWINVMQVVPTYLGLLTEHKASPVVLVMPDTDGGRQYGLQCLNDPHGVQDMTYVARDVPGWVAAHLRVQPPDLAWGIAGYSEGGFCAANIGLQNTSRFGFVGSLSGYFVPITSQVPVNGRPKDVNVFRHDRRLALINAPQRYLMTIPGGVTIPRFFLAAGAADPGDVTGAQTLREELMLRAAIVPLDIVQGGGHQATVWRAALTPMFEWMTPQLTRAAAQAHRAKRPVKPGNHKVKPVNPRVKPVNPNVIRLHARIPQAV
jgi:enterochelin esterase-like enzyme